MKRSCRPSRCCMGLFLWVIPFFGLFLHTDHVCFTNLILCARTIVCWERHLNRKWFSMKPILWGSLCFYISLHVLTFLLVMSVGWAMIVAYEVIPSRVLSPYPMICELFIAFFMFPANWLMFCPTLIQWCTVKEIHQKGFFFFYFAQSPGRCRLCLLLEDQKYLIHLYITGRAPYAGKEIQSCDE